MRLLETGRLEPLDHVSVAGELESKEQESMDRLVLTWTSWCLRIDNALIPLAITARSSVAQLMWSANWD